MERKRGACRTTNIVGRKGALDVRHNLFGESFLLERENSITTIFGFSCWFRFFLVRSEDWHMLRPLKL